MKNRLLLILIIAYSNFAAAQSFGFIFEKGDQRTEIPFEVKNDFIIVKVIFNKSFPLKFIFDTGAEHTVLSKKTYADILGLTYTRTVPLVGADMNTELTAYVTRNNHLKVGEAIAPTQDMLVLAEDYFKVDEFVGEEIHGILGADMFRHLVLKIDNKKNRIIISKPKTFKTPKKRWTKVPVQILRNKPYVQVMAHFNDTPTTIKLLLDTGASLSLLLYTNTHPSIELPEKFVTGSIGRGLGGYLYGYLGRLKRLEMESFFFNNIITNYQDISLSIDTAAIAGRNGILGNGLLHRFDLIINYPDEELYLHPHRNYNKSFQFDKSGLEIIAGGKQLKTISIYNIIENSAAAEAGIQKGDIIKSVNGMPIGFLNLKAIIQKMQKKEGKKIRLTILRNGKKMKFHFRLKRII